MQLQAMAAEPTGGESLIKDSDTANFAADVIEASMTRPMLVDFWAPWCQPCKQLGPIIEKVVRQAGGKVGLVKINIDEEPEIAGRLGVRSIPTVFAFVGGRPATGFAGAQPESQVRSFIERLVGGPLGPAPAEVGIEDGKAALTAGDFGAAITAYREVLKTEPENPEAIGGMARALIGLGRVDDAQSQLDQAPKDVADHSEIAGARAALTLVREAGELGDPQALQSRLSTNGDDHDARLQLATLLFLRGEIAAAIDHLMTIVRRDRSWNDDAARKQLLRFFDALGAMHPETIKGRRALSAVLFA